MFIHCRALANLRPSLQKRINYINPSPLAFSLSNSFHALVTLARRKISEEKARIEDEAASSLDVSRVCDIHMLLPRLDISLDQNRHVKARDAFSMRLYHSSGQLIEKNVELILREPARRGRNSDSEVLIADADGSEKWLLFYPIPLASISARTGDAAGEIVAMVRGMGYDGHEWAEIMALGSATAAGFEWVQMLGLIPIPPEGPFSRDPYQPGGDLETVIEESIATTPKIRQTPRPPPIRTSKPVVDVFSFLEQEEDQQQAEAARGPKSSAERRPSDDFAWFNQSLVLESLPADLVAVPWIAGGSNLTGGPFRLPDVDLRPASVPNVELTRKVSLHRSPSLHTLSESIRTASPSPSLQRSRRVSRASHMRRKSMASSIASQDSVVSDDSFMANEPEVLITRSRSVHADEDEQPHWGEEDEEPDTPRQRKPSIMDNIPILSPSTSELPRQSPLSVKEEISDSPPPVPPHRTPTTSRPAGQNPSQTPDLNPSPPASIRSGFGGRRRTSSPLKHEYDPSSPSGSDSDGHTESDNETTLRVEEDQVDQFEDEFEDQSEEQFEQFEDQVEDQVEDDEVSEVSSVSGSSDEDSDAISICSEEDDGEYPPTMLSIPRRISREPSGVITLPRQRPSSLSLDAPTITPESEKPAQFTPEQQPMPPPMPSPEPQPEPQQRELPQREPQPKQKLEPKPVLQSQSSSPTKSIAQPMPQLGIKFTCMVFVWATNQWEKLYPGECKIIITPGMIQAIPASSPPGTPGTPGTLKERLAPITPPEPETIIFSIELTAVTPVRRGTAVDISIRSPSSSKFKGASLMLRSRSPGEGETLLNAINNNRLAPTNLPPASLPSLTPMASYTSAEMTNESSTTLAGSIKRGFGSFSRTKSYRAGKKNSSSPSLMSGASNASLGSLASAFSRFRKGKFFKNSPLSSMTSSASNSIMGDSSGGGSPTSGLIMGIPGAEGNITMSNLKIRLYKRENVSKWRDMGAASLNILKPPEDYKGPAAPLNGSEKRIVVTNRKGNVIWVDEVLGETSFERIARTGIAVSIWTSEGMENGTGIPGPQGGIGGKSTVYMMQVSAYHPQICSGQYFDDQIR